MTTPPNPPEESLNPNPSPKGEDGGSKTTTPRKKRPFAQKNIPGIPKPPNEKQIKNVEKLIKSIEAHHEKTDDELLEAIKVKPENEHKVSHQLDREQQEARLVLMHRLLIRKVSPQDIQKQLDISQEMYYYLRPKLDAMMRLDISKLDVPYMIGDSLALYDEVRSMALMMASSAQVKDSRTKLQAMQVVLRAEADKNAFLTQCGVYAPQIIEHLIHGMVTSGVTVALSGQSKEETRRVEDMVEDLLKTLAVGSSQIAKTTRLSGDGPDVSDVLNLDTPT